MDPITLDPITRPCLTEIGGVYDYSSISRWLKKKQTDPLTGITLKTRTLLMLNPSDLDIFTPQDLRELSKKFWTKFWRSVEFKYEHEPPEASINVSGKVYDSVSFAKVELIGRGATFKNCCFQSCLFSVRQSTLIDCRLDKVGCLFTCAVVLRLLLGAKNQVKSQTLPVSLGAQKAVIAFKNERWSYFQHNPTPKWLLEKAFRKNKFEKIVIESSQIEHCAKCLKKYLRSGYCQKIIYEMYLQKSGQGIKN